MHVLASLLIATRDGKGAMATGHWSESYRFGREGPTAAGGWPYLGEMDAAGRLGIHLQAAGGCRDCSARIIPRT